MQKFLKYRLFIAIAVTAIVFFYGLKTWVPSSLWQSSPSASSSSSLAIIVVSQEKTTAVTSPIVATPPSFQYIEVLDGCGPYFTGTCVNMRSGPGKEYPIILHLRTGMVLRVADTILENGTTWYKIMPDNGVHYPERINGNWYVAAEYVHLFQNEGDKYYLPGANPTNNQRIIVDLSDQRLYAYDGDVLFMEEPISTGLAVTPTPRGKFTIFKKTPSRHMQGPIPDVSDQYFDLPGVPWNLYFTYEGAVIHGAYWHDQFGKRWSHGCVNLSPQKAKELYEWANEGASVVVRD